jgi:hypothetical protein
MILNEITSFTLYNEYCVNFFFLKKKKKKTTQPYIHICVNDKLYFIILFSNFFNDIKFA